MDFVSCFLPLCKLMPHTIEYEGGSLFIREIYTKIEDRNCGLTKHHMAGIAVPKNYGLT